MEDHSVDGVQKLGGRHHRLSAAAALPAAVLALAIALVAGCGKDDKVVAGGSGPHATYNAPTSPQNVLANLVVSYQARDSVQTAAVYDDAYEGTSADFASPTPSMVLLTKADEVRHVAWLKLDPNIVSVVLDLGSSSAWQRLAPDAADPPTWAQIEIQNWSVQLQDVGTATLSTARNNPLRYTFIPTVAAPGDTTWKIIRWTEIRN